MCVIRKSGSKKASKTKTLARHDETVKEAIKERLKEIFAAMKNSNGTLSLSQAARMYAVSKTTLYNRLQGRREQSEYLQTRQILTPEEKAALTRWVLQLYAWGWPAKNFHLRKMAVDLLKAKGETGTLGINWTSQFLKRHPELQSKYSRTLDQDRVFAENEEVFDT